MQKYFFPILTTAINKYLALDPESKPRLQTLEGKIITVELKGPNLIFQLHIVDGAIHLHAGEPVPSDTRITGTPLSLFRMALTKEKNNRKSFFGDNVTIEGNTHIAEQVIAIFDHLEIDWEEYTSHVIGDVAAHELGKFVRKIKSINQKIGDTLIQNTNEYLHEEIRLFPGQEELNDFYNEVDNVRMDVDRLATKIERLKKTA